MSDVTPFKAGEIGVCRNKNWNGTDLPLTIDKGYTIQRVSVCGLFVDVELDNGVVGELGADRFTRHASVAGEGAIDDFPGHSWAMAQLRRWFSADQIGTKALDFLEMEATALRTSAEQAERDCEAQRTRANNAEQRAYAPLNEALDKYGAPPLSTFAPLVRLEKLVEMKDAERQKVERERDELRKNRGVCDVCWTNSWVPVPHDDPDAIDVGGEFIRCDMCWMRNRATSLQQQLSADLPEDETAHTRREMRKVLGILERHFKANGQPEELEFDALRAISARFESEVALSKVFIRKSKALQAANTVLQDQLATKQKEVEELTSQDSMVNLILDKMQISRTACGGEGDAEVVMNTLDRLRVAQKLLASQPTPAPSAKSQRCAERLRLMDDAVDRYLELCRNGDGICDNGTHEDDCPLSERPCLKEDGSLCHWCQLDAARSGLDYEKIEAEYAEKEPVPAEPSAKSCPKVGDIDPITGHRWANADFPEDTVEFENGQHMCQCANCKVSFVGHPHRVMCKVCAKPSAGFAEWCKHGRGGSPVAPISAEAKSELPNEGDTEAGERI